MPRVRVRWPFAVAMLVAAGIAVTFVWLDETRAPEVVTITIAPVTLDGPADQFPLSGDAMADLVGTILERAIDANFRVVPRDATYTVTATAHRDGPNVVIVASIVTAKRQVFSLRVRKPADHAPALVRALGRGLASGIAGGHLDANLDETLSTTLVDKGNRRLDAGKFADAAQFFELAADANPASPDAWTRLALSLGQAGTTAPKMHDVMERAASLEPDGPRHALVDGMARVVAGDYRGARATLEPLEHAELAGTDRLQLLGYLGDANWRDGRFDAGLVYFERAHALRP